jgi:hypothetical protein
MIPPMARDERRRAVVTRVSRWLKGRVPTRLRWLIARALGNEAVVRSSRPWAAPGSFGALVGERKRWLDETLSPESAAYHYDIFKKVSQKRLARRLGLAVAADHLTDVPLAEAIAFVDRARLERFVIKPDLSRSAIGFRRIERRGDAYVDLATGTGLTLAGLERSLRRELAHLGRPDAWLVEEVLTPVGGTSAALEDYKFYCFGGTVEMILHKWPAPGGVGTQRNWYDREWNPLLVSIRGPGEGPVRAPLAGARLVAAAESAARSLCYPFIRVDLYDTDRGVVFGEFTPGPGLIETFTDAWSERLRIRWLEAEADLLERIASGALVPLVAEPVEPPARPQNVPTATAHVDA